MQCLYVAGTATLYLPRESVHYQRLNSTVEPTLMDTSGKQALFLVPRVSAYGR